MANMVLISLDDNTDTGYHQEDGQHENVEHDNANEQTSLLPNFVRRDIDQAEERWYRRGTRQWNNYHLARKIYSILLMHSLTVL